MATPCNKEVVRDVAPRARTLVRPKPGFRAECSTRAPVTDDVLMLVSSFDTVSALEAVRWMHRAVRDLLPGLAAGSNSAECSRLLRWLYGPPCTAEWGRLVNGLPVVFAVDCGRTRVVWTIRPVRFLPLVNRNRRALPGPAGRFAGPSSRGGRGCGEYDGG